MKNVLFMSRKEKQVKTKFVTLRIEEGLKADVQDILQQIGLTESMAVHLFYKQISLKKGLPFKVKIPGTEEKVSTKTHKRNRKKSKPTEPSSEAVPEKDRAADNHQAQTPAYSSKGDHYSTLNLKAGSSV